MSTRLRLVVAALLVFSGATAGSASFTRAAGNRAAALTAVTQYPPGVPGIVTPLPAGAALNSNAAKTRANPVTVRHPLLRAAPLPSLSVPVAPTPAQAGAATLQRSIVGVGSLDSAVTNFGAEFEPPDQGLCVGNGFVVEPVNSAYRIYGTNGRTIAGPFNVNDLFNEGGDRVHQ